MVLQLVSNRIVPCFQWEQVHDEYFCDAPNGIRLCVYFMPKGGKWHFAAWVDDQDGYIHDSNNKQDRSGFTNIESAKSAAVHYGRHPVIVAPGRKAS